MANTRSEKCCYISKHGGGYITCAQFLAEVICERLAKKDKTELPELFWSKPKWKRTFLYQVQVANGLLKLYKPEAIILALRHNPNIYSLNAKFLDGLIQAEQEVIERQEAQPIASVEPQSEAVEDTRPTFVEKKSTLNRLREL